MKLLTKEIKAKLEANHANQDDEGGIDYKPVVKLFTPWANTTWLLTELDPDGIAFGLCDLGLGCPELGYVPIDEIQEVRHSSGLKIERDRGFKAVMALSEYANAAREAGYIAA